VYYFPKQSTDHNAQGEREVTRGDAAECHRSTLPETSKTAIAKEMIVLFMFLSL